MSLTSADSVKPRVGPNIEVVIAVFEQQLVEQLREGGLGALGVAGEERRDVLQIHLTELL